MPSNVSYENRFCQKEVLHWTVSRCIAKLRPSMTLNRAGSKQTDGCFLLQLKAFLSLVVCHLHFCLWVGFMSAYIMFLLQYLVQYEADHIGIKQHGSRLKIAAGKGRMSLYSHSVNFHWCHILTVKDILLGFVASKEVLDCPREGKRINPSWGTKSGSSSSSISFWLNPQQSSCFADSCTDTSPEIMLILVNSSPTLVRSRIQCSFCDFLYLALFIFTLLITGLVYKMSDNTVKYPSQFNHSDGFTLPTSQGIQFTLI